MKKPILVLAMIIAVGFIFTSCKKDKKEDVKTEVKEELASNVLYQCPMDCEKGKSYTEAGACPVCTMALKEKKFDKDGNELCAKCGKDKAECKGHNDSEKDSTNHDGHDH